jgi:hypothetical protein
MWFTHDSKIEALESKVRELMTDKGTSGQSSQAASEPVPGTRGASVAESDNGDRDIIDRGFLDLKVAENYLELFRTILTPHFPFVMIPHQVSVIQLREEKPFLFLAIMASASYDNMPLQRLLGAEVKRAVASRIILNGEVSFDLLQGLLVYLAWYAYALARRYCICKGLASNYCLDRSHYHTKPHRYTQFLQLAVSLIIDLRLDRPPQAKTWKTKIHFKAQNTSEEHTFKRPSWGNDEKRAVIGCYYLSSA